MAKYIGLHLKNNESEAKETLEKLKVNGYVWQDNPYATNILSTNSVTVDAGNLRLFNLGQVTIPYLKELKKPNLFNKYLLVRNDLSIDLVEYINELQSEGLIDLHNHIASIGYNIETNEPVINNLPEDLHWGFFGASGSGKGISMRALIYQLAQFPESEYFIIDKDNDFKIIAGGKKVRFQQDYKDVTAYPQRFYNLMTYISLYQIVRAQKYIKYGCIDWRTYNDKRREDIEKNGTTEMELIPYSTFILDEFQTFRNESLKLMKEEEFDRKINMILSVCRANGIRVIVGTQDTQKNIIGNSLSNVQTRCFFKLDSMSNSMGVPENVFPNFRGPQMKKAYVFYLGGRGFVKFPFTEPTKLDTMIRAKLDNVPDGYVEWKANTIMDLLLSVAKMTDSKILSMYYDMFGQIGFGEEKVKRLEKNDDFLVLVATVYAMFRYYQLGLLANKSLDFMVSIQESAFGGGDSAKVDAIIYDYIKLLANDKYSLITKGIQNAILGKVCSDRTAQIEEGIDPDDDRKNFIKILSNIMNQYYDQQIHETDLSDVFMGTGTGSDSSYEDEDVSAYMPSPKVISAAKLIIQKEGEIGPSTIQREMKMGYAHAARILDALVEIGDIELIPGKPGRYRITQEEGEILPGTIAEDIEPEVTRIVEDDEDVFEGSTAQDEITENYNQGEPDFVGRVISETNEEKEFVVQDDSFSEGDLMAARVILGGCEMISPSTLSGRLKIPMATSAKILEKLHTDGLVGPADDILMREVLKDAENKPNSLDIVVDENTKSEEQAPPPPKKKGKDVLDSVFDGL